MSARQLTAARLPGNVSPVLYWFANPPRGGACQSAGSSLPISRTWIVRASSDFMKRPAYRLPLAIVHAATKRELVAKERPADWVPPNMF